MTGESMRSMWEQCRLLAFFLLSASLLHGGYAERTLSAALLFDQSHGYAPPATDVQEAHAKARPSSWAQLATEWQAPWPTAAVLATNLRGTVNHSSMLLACVLLAPMFCLVLARGKGQPASNVRPSKYMTFIETQGRSEALTTWQIILRGLVISMPCITSGYNNALLSAELPSLEADFGGHDSLLGWVAASYCVGCVVGSVANALLVERWGRLHVHRWLTVTLYCSQVLMLAAPTFAAFLAGRVLMGAACGCANSLGPIYTAELAPKDLRGLLVGFTEWTEACGQLIGFSISAFPSMTFREHALVGLSFPLVTLLLTPLLTESPRWLAQQGRIEEARAVLEVCVQDHKEAAETAVALRERAGTGPFSSHTEHFVRLFCDPVNRAKLLWPAMLMCFGEMVGIEVSEDYCVRFLLEAGVPNRSMTAQITVANVALTVVGLVVSGCLLDRWGRKSWLLASFAVQAAALCYLGSVYGHGNWVPVVAAWIVYNIAFGTGAGNVSLLVMAESFSDPSLRVVAVCFCYVLNRAVAAVFTGLYPALQTLVGTANVFLLWAFCAAAAFIATTALMTERGGTILEQD